MYATNYYETAALNALRGVSTNAPTTAYMGLYLSNPGNTGTAGTEVSYSGYARQAVTFSAPAPINGNLGVQNVADIIFPKTNVAVGTITHIGVSDSLVGGNMLIYGEFTEPMVNGADESPVIVAGLAQWWLIGTMSTSFKTRLLNFLRGQAMTGFGAYMALYSGSPDAGGAELSGANYARLSITFSSPTVQSGGQMQMASTTALTSNRASTPWGAWAYSVIMDAATGGQAVDIIPVDGTPKNVKSGNVCAFTEGNVRVALN